AGDAQRRRDIAAAAALPQGGAQLRLQRLETRRQAKPEFERAAVDAAHFPDPGDAVALALAAGEAGHAGDAHRARSWLLLRRALIPAAVDGNNAAAFANRSPVHLRGIKLGVPAKAGTTALAHGPANYCRQAPSGPGWQRRPLITWAGGAATGRAAAAGAGAGAAGAGAVAAVRRAGLRAAGAGADAAGGAAGAGLAAGDGGAGA